MTQSIGATALSLWRKLPIIVRATVVGLIVAEIGSTVGVLPLLGNVKFHPEIPWALPVTVLLMGFFWLYFTGSGWPASTRSTRRHVTRSKTLSLSTWLATLPALLFATVTIVAFRLALPSILPFEPPKMPLDLSKVPNLTLFGLLASIAISSAVAEEVGFRGYLQKPLEDRHGIAIALIVTGLAFWFAHSDKVAWTHLPFHMLASILLGLVVYLTKSLLPAILGHAIGDALLQPAYLFHQPRFVWSALTERPIWQSMPNGNWYRNLQLLLKALEPGNMLQGGPHQIFAVLTWVFVASFLLTILSLFMLARFQGTTRPVPDAAADEI